MDDERTKEALRREMHRTAQDLTDKLGRLEGALSETYEEGKVIVDKVTGTVQTLSPSRQIRKRPLVWTGGAVVGGFILGRLALGPGGAVGLPVARALTRVLVPGLRSLAEMVFLSAARYAAGRALKHVEARRQA
jgi:hypothetical protein